MTAPARVCPCGALLTPSCRPGQPAKHCSDECRNATRRAKAAIERSARPGPAPKPIRLCEIHGCGKPRFARGLCQMHNWRQKKHGDPLALLPKDPFPERFWDKVYPCPITGCWFWAGALDPAGYGRSADGDGGIKLAHRIAYELEAGPIPVDRPHLDHLCRVRCCVWIGHLEPVTQQENNRRQHLAWLRRRAADGMVVAS